MRDVQLDILTYSSGTTLCLCEKKYQLRYEQGLRPRRDDNESLVIGSWTHLGCETLRKRGLAASLQAIDQVEAETPAIGPDVFKIQQRAAQARAMVRVASERWPADADPRAMTEHVVEMPVRNPDGGTSRTFRFCGVVDGVEGGTLVDWKTVSDPHEFIQSRNIGYQTELYAAALADAGIHITSAVFRLITKPTIKFCNKDGGNPQVYEDRCVEWLKEEPGRLVEHEMWVNQGRIREARYWLWSVSKRVLENRRSGRWLRNEYACRNWSRTCEYMPICEAEASGGDPSDIIRDGFTDSDAHPELTRRQGPDAA